MIIEGSIVLDQVLNSTARNKVLEGGARSTKTWSLIQDFILYCMMNEGKTLTVLRKRLTWLRSTVLKDFVTVLKMYGLYDENYHNKTDNIIYLFGNEIWFIGLDERQKLHGRTQDRFWINEAVEATKDDFTQLEIRTREDCILDYNPSTTKHWIYDSVLTRKDADFIHSTMLDNPFLSDGERAAIMGYEPTEENIARGTADKALWLIYGLGKRAQQEGLVFDNVDFVRSMPPPEERKWTVYGLDFGFTNDPTALVEVVLAHGQLWFNELIYQKAMTNADIAGAIKALNLGRAEIVADSSEPKSIEELRRLGLNVKGAAKGQDSVRAGIMVMKQYKINVTESSINLKDEFGRYKWKKDESSGTYLNQPIDNFNHGIDAGRYGTNFKISGRNSKVLGMAWA